MHFIQEMIKKWEIPREDKNEFYLSVDKININRGKYTSFMFTFMILVLILGSYLGNETGIYKNPYYIDYIGMYSFMLFFMILAFHKFLFMEKSTQKSHKEIWILGDIIILLILAWSVGMSLMDQRTSGQIIIYMIAVVSMAFTQIIPPIHFFFELLFAQILFVGLLPLFQKNETSAFMNAINSFGFVCIAWAISCMRFKKQIEDFQLKKLLNKKNDELTQANRELEYLSKIDGMTGIYNRHSLDCILDEAVKRCRQEEEELSLLMIDIDDFKIINDSYGHQIGDNCIKRIGSVLHEIMQKWNCICARYGGDEFVIILEAYHMDKIQQLMKEIEQRLNKLSIYIPEQNCRIVVSVSMGIFTKIPEKEEGKDYISQVDVSLYAEKRRKKGYIG